MKTLDTKVESKISEVSKIAGYLWNREWAERNAGNISIDFSEFFNSLGIPENSIFIPYDFPADASDLTLFVTGTGCYLRTLIDSPEQGACILHINKEASGYHILWGGESTAFRPTSELISHVKIHAFNRLHKPTHKAILHTHPIELIVLSHHHLFNDEEKFNHSLWKMCPEVRVFIPQGVFCAPYRLSGSEALADITIEGLKSRNVILWEKHGALATGENIDKAFDFLDVANKGAKMLLLAWSAGFEPTGLTVEEMKELEKFFN